jgi:hypothetical protein
MKLKVRGNPATHSRVRLTVSGFNAHQSPDSFYLELYIVDRRVFRQCPRVQNDMVNLFIGNGDAVNKIGQWSITGGRYRVPVTYRHLEWSKVLYCAYARYIYDDAAVGALKHDLRRRS